MTVANYAMKLEREVWGVLDGAWGSDTWMGWRRDWAQKASGLYSVTTSCHPCGIIVCMELVLLSLASCTVAQVHCGSV